MGPIFNCLPLLITLAVSSLATPLHHVNDAKEAPVRLLYEYPLGTWVENIAVRPTGELLLTLVGAPQIDQLDPFQADSVPSTVAILPNGNSNLGIAEVENDVFAVVHGNFSFTAGATPGSWSIWTISFPQPHVPKAEAAKVADMPADAQTVDGLTNLPSASKPENLIAGDVRTGKIYRINTTSGAVDIPFDNNLTALAPDPDFGEAGVNGLHVKESVLYFANTGQDILARLPIHENGDPAGPATVVTHALPDVEYDDFALRGDFAYMTTGFGDSIERVSLDGRTKDRIIAGVVNTTTIAEPTSAAFGRTVKDKDVLYVVTGGGLAAPIDGNITVGGQVLAIDLSNCGW